MFGNDVNLLKFPGVLVIDTWLKLLSGVEYVYCSFCHNIAALVSTDTFVSVTSLYRNKTNCRGFKVDTLLKYFETSQIIWELERDRTFTNPKVTQ